MKTTKLLIVDDHPLTRAGIITILEAKTEIEIIGEAKNGLDAIKQVAALLPDIVVMDITMPQLSGIEATREIIIKQPRVKVIALSMHSGEKFVRKILDAGAVGYLLKDEAPEELLRAIEKVEKGDIYLSSGVTRVALSNDENEGEITGINILKTHLQRPPVSPDYICRSIIIDELERNIGNPLSLISAGVGYGKSVAASQWLERSQYLTTWISLDQEHSDLQIFILYLIEAFEKVIPGSLKKTSDAIARIEPLSSKQLTNILFNDLCVIEKNIILVLDDYYNINNERIHNLLDEWLTLPPPQVHLCIITRRDPPISKINSLRICGRLTEIRMKALSFTKDEIISLFKETLGIKLNDSAILKLYDKTEGWILALRLVIMIIKGGKELNQVLKTIEGGMNAISDYLITEVLSNLPEHIKDRLLILSILNRFCGELLDTIVLERVEKGQQHSIGKEFISWLRKENMFVINLDDEGKWFRYHQIFQTLLQIQLQNQYSKDEIVDMHIKASHWFEDHDFLMEAMYHALAIENYDRAVEIVNTHRLPLLNTGNWYRLELLWRMLPTSIIEKKIELLLIDGYLGFYHADLARMMEVSNKLESLVADLDKDSNLYGEFLWNKGYAVMFFEPGSAKALDLLTLAKDKISPETAPEPLALTELHFGIFSQANGKYEFANNWLKDRIREGKSIDIIRLNRLLLSHAIVNTNEARLLEVEKYCSYALKIARESKIKDHIGTCLMITGEMYARHGHWNRVVPTFEEVIDIKDNVHSRGVIECMTGLVVSYCMQRKTEKAQDMINSVKRFTHVHGEYFEKFLWSCRLRYHMLMNEVDVIRELLPQGSGWEIVNFSFWFDVPEITYCHALIFEGSEVNIKLADKKLKRLVEIATALHNSIHLIEIYALQAVLFDQLEKMEQAREVLVKSLELAEPGRVIGYYLEIGKPFKHLVNKMPDEIKERQLIKDFDKVLKTMPLYQLEKQTVKVANPKRQEENLNALTPRELEVLQYVAKGLRNQEIAEKLFNSEETIKKHIYHMFQKLHVKNRLSLVNKATEEAILPKN